MATRIGAGMPPIVYLINGQKKSIDFGRAFAKGCGGRMVYHSGMLHPGDVALFGHPSLFGWVVKARSEGRNWYYGDKAYFGRDTYYRITKNAYMSPMNTEPDYDRWHQTGFKISPWRSGDDILLCPQSDVFFQLHDTTQSEWLKKTTEELRRFTGRSIRVHHKKASRDTEKNFREALTNVWAVVVYSSMAGAQAAVHGVPCFATNPDCVSAKFGSTDLSMIESPIRPDNREYMAAVLAANQWTLSEIQKGIAWERVK